MNTTTTGNRPSLAIYHANGRGTGCAAKFELCPAKPEIEGYVLLTLANQCGVREIPAEKCCATKFDWENAIAVKLCFPDLCAMLQVFRGETESLTDGKGIFHRLPQAAVGLHLSHLIEPCNCYRLEAYRRVNDATDEARFGILLMPSEALGLCLAIENSMGLIAFGE